MREEDLARITEILDWVNRHNKNLTWNQRFYLEEVNRIIKTYEK